jgi:chromosome segregation ATPase
VTTVVIIAVMLAIGCIVLGLIAWRDRRRHQELRRLLDNADAREEVLHQARRRMADMKNVVGRVAPDIGAVAQASLEADGPVQQGLRNVLEHRLWIARNAESASLHELQRAVAALQRSHTQIAQRLEQLEGAAAELNQAARAVEEQEAREPSSLRRGPPGA